MAQLKINDFIYFLFKMNPSKSVATFFGHKVATIFKPATEFLIK